MTFTNQHRKMVEIADEIVAAARDGRADRLRSLSALRLELSKEVRDHVDEETALIRAKRGGEAPVRADQNALISKYHDDLLVWRQQLTSCNTSWSPKRISEDAQGFLAEFQPIRDALDERVRWEEQVFYPRVLGSADLVRPVQRTQRA